MSGDLTYVDAHIPESLYASNPYMQKLVAVFNAMVDYRKEQLDRYSDSFDPQIEYRLETLRKHIDEFNGEYVDIVPSGMGVPGEITQRWALERFYLNKRYIFSCKGTAEGFRRLIWCLCNGIVTVLTHTVPNPLLHFSNLQGSVLPNGQDLADELGGVMNPPKIIPTLFDTSWLPLYNNVYVKIKHSTDTSIYFNTFVKNLVPLYLTAIDENSSNITIVFSNLP